VKPLRRSGTDHTVLPAITPSHHCLPLPHKRSPDGASPDWGCEHLITAYSSFYLPRKDERLSRPGWLTYSGWFTHQLQVEHRTGKVRRSKTNVLLLYQRSTATNRYGVINVMANSAKRLGKITGLLPPSCSIQQSSCYTCYTEDSCRPANIDSCQKQLSQISFHALSFQKI